MVTALVTGGVLEGAGSFDWVDDNESTLTMDLTGNVLPFGSFQLGSDAELCREVGVISGSSVSGVKTPSCEPPEDVDRVPLVDDLLRLYSTGTDRLRPASALMMLPCAA